MVNIEDIADRVTSLIHQELGGEASVAEHLNSRGHLIRDKALESLRIYFETKIPYWPSLQGGSYIATTNSAIMSCDFDIAGLLLDKRNLCSLQCKPLIISVTPDGHILYSRDQYRGHFDLYHTPDELTPPVLANISQLSSHSKDGYKLVGIQVSDKKETPAEAIEAAEYYGARSDQIFQDGDKKYVIYSDIVAAITPDRDVVVTDEILAPFLVKAGKQYTVEQTVTGKHIRSTENVQLIELPPEVTNRNSVGLLSLLNQKPAKAEPEGGFANPFAANPVPPRQPEVT